MSFSVEEIRKMMENMMLKRFRPIRWIYIDLNFFQDTYLGTLLTQLKTKVEYEYIHSQLFEYTESTYGAIQRHFPALKISDDVLTSYRENVNNHSNILVHSPHTDFFNSFPMFYEQFVSYNKTVEANNSMPNIILNFEDLEIDERSRDYYISTFQSQFPSIKIDLIQYPVDKLPRDILELIDIMCVHDAGKMFKNGSEACKMLTAEFYWINTLMFSLPIIDKSLDIKPEEESEALQNVVKLMSIVSNFRYIKPGLSL